MRLSRIASGMAFGLALLTSGCGASTSRDAPCTLAPQVVRGCPTSGVAVQILGSGGPIPDDERASAGYVVWIDGKARLLVDAGGGVFLRFGQAEAAIDDLEAVAITHLHADHVSDLPALLKGGYFAARSRPLPLLGPTGNERFPSMSAFMQRMFHSGTGAFHYLAGHLSGEGGLFEVPVVEIDAGTQEPVRAYSGDLLQVEAVGVHHGPVPALGYLVTARGKRIAFSGDQSADRPAFASLIEDADTLFMDYAIPQHGAERARALHATPSEIGALAAEADVRRLVLSHLMPRSLASLEKSLKIIERRYAGRIEVGRDLACYALD